MANEKRLISAEQAYEVVRLHHNDFAQSIADLTSLREVLEDCDTVEVVRCKDCKYWQDNNDGYPHEECRWGHGETPDANDFCSCGERKEYSNKVD